MEKKFRTKNERHEYDNEKRRVSLLKKLREQQSQKDLIKNALSDGITPNTRKIVFDNEIFDGNVINNGCAFIGEKDLVEKPKLFEDLDSDREENYEIKIKSQFEGKTGQKLLNLQSRYNNDERFKLDGRFKDDNDDSDEEDDKEILVNDSNGKDYGRKNDDSEPDDFEKERTKQFKVLETVLGRPIKKTADAQKKLKRSFFEMVRFNASNEDHKRQQNNAQNQKDEASPKKKKLDKEERKRRRKEEMEKQGSKTSKTSQNAEKKFYEVTDDLKAALKNRQSENSHFSLLAAFSKKPEIDEKDEEEVVETEDVSNRKWHERDDERHQKDLRILDSEPNETNEESKEVVKVQGITKEKFFLIPGDPRIEEGLTFMNMKNSEEAGVAAENYDQTRRDIREVLRLRRQKHRQKNNPFKKKIGGSNKLKMPFNNNRSFRSTDTRRRR